MRIFYCKKCKNIVTFLEEKKGNLVCCNEEMVELIANDTDASLEKHVPVISENNNVINIRVGKIEHPMEENHYISFIIVETNKRTIIYHLTDKPEVNLTLDNEEIINVYEYCNLHGLWKLNKK